MDNAQWWSSVSAETRDWLMANNGQTVPASVAAEVASAGGPAAVPSDDEVGLFYPDEVTDWIEETSNGE